MERSKPRVIEQETCKGQWRNVATVAPFSFWRHEKKGDYELKVFGCKTVPYVGQFNFRWRRENIWSYKKLQGRQRAYEGRKNPYGAKKKWRPFLFYILETVIFCVGAKNFSRGRQILNLATIRHW